MTEDETKALIVQLEQLNERSRWYGARRWQIPFAYVAVVGLVISRIPYLCGAPAGSIYVVLGLLGVVVSWSMSLIEKREDDAVDKLILVEGWLKIPDVVRASSSKGRGVSAPLFYFVVGAGGLLLLIGIALVAGAFYPLFPLNSEFCQYSQFKSN